MLASHTRDRLLFSETLVKQFIHNVEPLILSVPNQKKKNPIALSLLSLSLYAIPPFLFRVGLVDVMVYPHVVRSVEQLQYNLSRPHVRPDAVGWANLLTSSVLASCFGFLLLERDFI